MPIYCGGFIEDVIETPTLLPSQTSTQGEQNISMPGEDI